MRVLPRISIQSQSRIFEERIAPRAPSIRGLVLAVSRTSKPGSGRLGVKVKNSSENPEGGWAESRMDYPR
ncbi:hypothetical protein Dda_8719 [Drechslerella dactyloides]|uniref:Uncharacterized protein n=1 Tax=Drechslerella dactyloides TaxID=74499 RepID=A0AAD6IQT9_DREDA|nr:hypothetical protein Dda_8719 [Drechslerella dactyloides]